MLMRATGRGSISSFLKLAVDAAWVLACALLGFIWIIAAISVIYIANGGQPLMGFEKIAFESPMKVTQWTLTGSILSVGVMIICAYLRGVFETLVARDPFVPENAKRFTLIAVVLAVMEASSMFVSALVSLIFSTLGLIEGGQFQFPNVNLPVWFAVLTLLVLGQVFKEGAAMREEQKMTI
jgi:hypothetical protein